ncbi:MAG TPA: molybdopterin-guanine dinucleotide biosynthesis protein B [Thermoanaerobaculia bacterium]|nr:molybdopterin-guanine dinucleotide biosynthesis protein B [Thermoanaerobaculia bacterium]
MKVAAITGFSGAGKTTLLVQLIARYVAQGLRVGAIKHTHHHLNEENRGDTARLRAAGADPVILAGPQQAVIFANDAAPLRVPYERPRDLLVHFDHDIVLVEGFKELGDWPQISISDQARPTVEELAANLDRIWRP